MSFNNKKYFCVASVGLLLVSNICFAGRLEPVADAPLIVVLGANVILYAHILGGMIGLSFGVVASLSKKGGKLHRFAGRTYYWSMLLCYAIALTVAPFLPEEQAQNSLAAMLSLYLVLSAVYAAKTRPYRVGLIDKLGVLCTLIIIAFSAYFASYSATDPSEAAGVYYMFMIVSSVALLGDLTILVRGELAEKARIARHVWRICFSFFIGTGSLFFGQAQLFPSWFNESVLPQVFGVFPLLVLTIGVPIVLLSTSSRKLPQRV